MTGVVFAGVMSGTSLDGIDAVIARFPASAAMQPFNLCGTAFSTFPEEVRAELLALQNAGTDEIARASRVSLSLADCYAQAVRAAAQNANMEISSIRAVGVHGQTLRHHPQEGWSYQLNQPARVAEQLNIDVVADFRSRDLAAGGQGAPLAPVFHRTLLKGAFACVIVNIGGMANITDLTRPEISSGFDSGPGNVLLDGWYGRHHRETFDRDGAWAAAGQASQALLRDLLDDSFFEQPPPKSTGRDRFNLRWLDNHLKYYPNMMAVDVQATLLMLTATSIAQAIERYASRAEFVYVCGGGAYNRALMTKLATLMKSRTVDTTETLGVAPQHVEALAFAWLARETIARRALDMTKITGAHAARILGAVYFGK
ncbi:MAG: anhydro-N-acetylmuramic acid kinase [Burkholderiales bacterium]|jgi:anhydro-N-acetylmuramic acid kinase|nr:anhydro-N-acetylmuramic acid kinase [Burkholderiales bacterium]